MPFTLNASRLAGLYLAPRFLDLETGGDFHSVQFQVVDALNNSDIEVHNIKTRFTVGAEDWENPSTRGTSHVAPRYLVLETGGDARAVQFQITESVVGSDLEIHGLSALVTIDTENLEN